MRSTGIVRKMDELGRVVIPKETRKVLEINEGDPIEFFIEGENIILKSYKPGCIFCGDAKDIVNYKGKNICKNCLKELKK